MATPDYAACILRTGFALEHAVSKSLRRSGWTVISNKYYVDDNEDTVREIDLVAYKAKAVENFVVYTALIISCKKSEANAWALLSRPLDKNDPNREWRPLHLWSNDRVLEYQLKEKDFSEKYHDLAASSGGVSVLDDPEVDVFAFQEMNKNSGAPQNDRAIFSSITSLMKAQAYELNSLPSRKSDTSIYNFSLLTVVDSNLVRILFDEDAPVASSIDSESYIASYIIGKKEQFSRIRFIESSVFESRIREYDDLHRFNCSAFRSLSNDFYDDVLKDQNKVKVLLGQFTKLINQKVALKVYRKFNEWPDLKSLSIYWQKSTTKPAVMLDLTQEQVDMLSADVEICAVISDAFSKVYRYEGGFELEVDVPF